MPKNEKKESMRKRVKGREKEKVSKKERGEEREEGGRGERERREGQREIYIGKTSPGRIVFKISNNMKNKAS